VLDTAPLPPLRLLPSLRPGPVWLDGSRRLCATHRVPGRLATMLRDDAYCDACTEQLAAHDAAACYSLESLLRELDDTGTLDDAGSLLDRAREVGRYTGPVSDYSRSEAAARCRAVASWLDRHPIDCRVEVTPSQTWVEVRWAVLVELGAPVVYDDWAAVDVAPGIAAWAEVPRG